jgi:hypothetical protein
LARRSSAALADVLWTRLENSRTKWLLVFDQADDPALLTIGKETVGEGRGWVRSSPRGTVLITSRYSEPGVWGSHVIARKVQPLRDTPGGEVLLDLAPEAGTVDKARELSEILEVFPWLSSSPAAICRHSSVES